MVSGRGSAEICLLALVKVRESEGGVVYFLSEKC